MFLGVLNLHNVRVVFKKDVSIPQLGLSHRAGTTAEVPLYLAIRLEELGAVEIDESQAVQPREVATLRYREQKESLPVELPESFYARAKLAHYLLSKKGDVKNARALAQEVRELAIERLKKFVVLLASRPEVADDQDFLKRLTPEERALLFSLHVDIFPS